jgi:cysteine desulfuration protein SufE
MKTLDELVEIFELLGDWDQRYAFIIDIGEGMPEMPEVLKTEDNKVKGCMSQVWISAYSKPEQPGQIYFQGDSDTAVIKGVLALLIQLSEAKTAEEIQQLDVDEFFERLQLDEHLSPNRHVGVYAMVELMKQQAAAVKMPSANVTSSRTSPA